MKWRSLIWFICLVLILTPSLWAQEQHAEDLGTQEVAAHEPELDSHGNPIDSHGEGAGDPNIFDGGPNNIIMSLAVFVILLAVLGKWAWGPILAGLQKREEHV
ncbi:MAG: ATP synthase F0 subunit B, partial [Planctomycetes bacterium]|nr:ATP synthase F0 subunit B [Planctomycetota bacterium]